VGLRSFADDGTQRPAWAAMKKAQDANRAVVQALKKADAAKPETGTDAAVSAGDVAVEAATMAVELAKAYLAAAEKTALEKPAILTDAFYDNLLKT